MFFGFHKVCSDKASFSSSRETTEVSGMSCSHGVRDMHIVETPNPPIMRCIKWIPILLLPLLVQAQSVLPSWVFTNGDAFLEFHFQEDMDASDILARCSLEQPDWVLITWPKGHAARDWQRAAFQLKQLIVEMRAIRASMKVGLDADDKVVESLMMHDLAAYIDGYLFEDIPSIPDGDPTGKGWFRSDATPMNYVRILSDSGSVGAYVVLLNAMKPEPQYIELLDAINATGAGSIEWPSGVLNLPNEAYQFYFDPGTSTYFLAYVAEESGRTLYVDFKKNIEIDVVYPRQTKTRATSYGERLEIETELGPHLIKLKMKEPEFQVENIRVQSTSQVDPYELVVKNQVFKKNQAGIWKTLKAKQDLNYRYQAPTGATVDVTFRDTLLWEKGQPIEHVREKMFFNGVAWPYEDLPELPLIQPEKVQSEPLVLDLDTSYSYEYAGTDSLKGHACWKVKFNPKGEGNYYRGTVWIDQETGAHHKVRAIQSGLEPPVVGHEMTVFYDWVKVNGRSYWLQVREESLQVLNVVGVRIPLQISSERSEFEIDAPEFTSRKIAFYNSDALILRDTDEGFRYLKPGKDGKRIVSDQVFTRQKFVVGGVLYDPGMDYPVPLAGFNYVDLDFLGKGYQTNVFLAGAINDVILSHNNFLGKGWDLSAELFVSALYFSDSVYRNGEEVLTEEVEKLTESFNLTLGIPMGPFFKMEANLATRFIDFKEGDDMEESFVLPSNHFENQAKMDLFFNRGRVSSHLDYRFVKRSDWQAWGFPDDQAPLFDSYRKLEWDSSYSMKLPKFQTLRFSASYLKGWDLDRFSSFGFGFFENHVAGFGTSGIEASQAVRLRAGYQRGVKELFQLGVRFDVARAWQDDLYGVDATADGSPVDLMGIGVNVNMIGPWKTVIRVEVGYGLDADLENEAGDVTGQLVFLKLF